MVVHPFSSCPPQKWLLHIGTFSRVPSAMEFPSSAPGVPFPACGVLLLAPQAVPTQPALVLCPGLTSEPKSQCPAPRPSISSCGVQAGGLDDLCSSHSALLFAVQLLHFSR